MKNTWKEFLFFNKKDRNGIILLLILIALMAIFFISANSFSRIDPKYLAQQEESLAQFKAYESQLTDKIIILNELIEEKSPKDIKKTNGRSKAKTTPKLTKGEIINLNQANLNTLTRIPGIGNTIAKRIVEHREINGQFNNVEQLLEIKGITNKKISQIIRYIRLSDQ